jgi:hypothetical protein
MISDAAALSRRSRMEEGASAPVTARSICLVRARMRIVVLQLMRTEDRTSAFLREGQVPLQSSAANWPRFPKFRRGQIRGANPKRRRQQAGMFGQRPVARRIQHLQAATPLRRRAMRPMSRGNAGCRTRGMPPTSPGIAVPRRVHSRHLARDPIGRHPRVRARLMQRRVRASMISRELMRRHSRTSPAV